MNVDIHPQRILSLCSGVGMLDEGVKLGLEYFGVPSQVVAYVERDSYAAGILLARMGDKALEPAPISDDLADIDERWRGKVDWIVSGFPCQPWSHAGKQEGTEDERWLWPTLFRIGLAVRPQFWFLENVPGLVSGGGLELVLSDLAKGGWDAEWMHITAESVGASHRRERVFVLAHAGGKRFRETWGRASGGDAGFADGELALSTLGGLGIMREPSGGDGFTDGGNESLDNAPSPRPTRSRKRRVKGETADNGQQTGMPGLGERCGTVGDTSGPRTGEHSPRSRPRDSVSESSGLLADTISPRQQERGSLGRNNGAERQAVERNCLPLFAPGPGADWGSIPKSHWPATEPGFRVLVDGLALVVDESRADQLRCGGNGVVATAAAVAFVELMRGAMK